MWFSLPKLVIALTVIYSSTGTQTFADEFHYQRRYQFGKKYLYHYRSGSLRGSLSGPQNDSLERLLQNGDSPLVRDPN